uniref:Cas1_AcylT domain-containing protein n=1 Tax=Angiostrongylus cantonensis TaxID=6313 RepID=A0A0K0DHS1_ANGCA
MAIDVEVRSEEIKNKTTLENSAKFTNGKVGAQVQPVDPTKRCNYCGREGIKMEPERKKIDNGEVDFSQISLSKMKLDSLRKVMFCVRWKSKAANYHKSVNVLAFRLYLSIILGNNIDLTMTSTERFYFKKDYEKFKLRFTLFNLFPLAIAFIFPSRLGSWWVAHHYLACVIGGVALTWPDDASYQKFHTQFLLFAVYICLLQQLQYQYQSGCLRRLHSLGHGDSMDVTLEGFATWMFHGLTFLLPFLAVMYMLELYNSYTLYCIWRDQGSVWQVGKVSFLIGY